MINLRIASDQFDGYPCKMRHYSEQGYALSEEDAGASSWV